MGSYDESIANESIDFENMSISELMEWLKDNLPDADDNEANSNNANIAQETLYNKVVARDGSDYELMIAGNYLSDQGVSTPYSEDSETPYVEGFQALPAGHDWTRTSLSPWEQAQMGQMGTENQLSQRAQGFGEMKWGEEFGRSGEQWGQEFDLKKARQEYEKEHVKWSEKLDEAKYKLSTWDAWSDDVARRQALMASIPTKSQFIQAGLAQSGQPPQMPEFMGDVGLQQSRSPWGVASNQRPLGAQAATMDPGKRQMLANTSQWEGWGGYGPNFGGVSSSPVGARRVY